MILDIFNQDVFGVVSLTEAINHLPHVPSRIGSLNLFTPDPISTTSAVLEEQFGKISLLGTRPRGSSGTQTNQRNKRKVRTVGVPHIPQDDAVIADEVQGVRAFGTEDTTELFSTVVNNKLARMRQNHEVTAEFHRAGAVRGHVLDDDGSTILDIFDLFQVVEQSFAFPMTASNGDLKQMCLNATRHIRDALGADGFGGVHALCGDDFFDALVKSPEVRDTYLRFQGNEFARNQQAGKDGEVFTWGGIMWENYRGRVGAIDFMAPTEARLFPVGVPNLFKVYYAPADYVETVNTLGRPFYAKQERMKFDKGIELQSQSNPLHICTRPATLCLGTVV